MYTILICKGVRFYSRKDEDRFFEWINNIECIEKFDGVRDELYLYISSHDLHDNDLRDLIALFYRYKIDMKQLVIFLNFKNKEWFFESPKGYWHRRVFGK